MMKLMSPRKWFKPKPSVLVFGTGAAAIRFYKKYGQPYRITGFLDNNLQKQGQSFFSKPIYAPSALGSLQFEKIVIASNFFQEIRPQLLALGIPAEKIIIFTQFEYMHSSPLHNLSRWAKKSTQAYLCKHDGVLASTLFRMFFSKPDMQGVTIKRMQLLWLDEAEQFKVGTLRPKMEGVVQGPRVVGKETAPVPVTIPEVALYHFTNACTSSVSQSLILPELATVVIERVTTAITDNADYAGSQVLQHAGQGALVRWSKPTSLGKGIVINSITEINYYHWLIDAMSQLQFVNELPERYSEYPVLISASTQKMPSIKLFLDHLGVKRPIVFLQNGINYQVDDLLVITAPNNLITNLRRGTHYRAEYGFFRPESIFYLREKGLQLIREVDMTPFPKRIFLARKSNLRQYNQHEILPLAQAHGFTPVYMEDWELPQQIAIIANAQVIMGPTGAAWTNLLFAAKGAKGLCWMSEEFGAYPCFSNLAAIVGVDLDFLSHAGGAKETRLLYSVQYKLDQEAITNWLRSLPAVGLSHPAGQQPG